MIPKLLVSLARIALRDWPQHYPDFFSQLEALVEGAKGKESRRMGLQLLVVVLEEFPLGPDGTRGGVSGKYTRRVGSSMISLIQCVHAFARHYVVGREQKWRTMSGLVPTQKANSRLRPSHTQISRVYVCMCVCVCMYA